jgi:HAMP domain-containing protein
LLSNLNVLGGEEDGVEREFVISLLLPDTQAIQTVLYITADPQNNDLNLYTDPTDQATWEGWVFASQQPAQYEIYEEEGKFWAQSSAPIVDSNRAPVGAVLDVFVNTDNQISAVNSRLQRIILTAALIAYPLMLAAVFLVAFTATRALQRLMNAAQALDRGEDYQAEWLAPVMKRQDEFGKLASVFDHMAVEVQGREAKLKNEIIKLKIEIDYGKQKQQVDEIIGSDYFQDLKNKSAELRGGKGGGKVATGELSSERASTAGPDRSSSGSPVLDEDDYMTNLKKRAEKMRPAAPKTDTPPSDSPEA